MFDKPQPLHPDTPRPSPAIDRRWVLLYTAVASLTGGMVGHGAFFLADHLYDFTAVQNLWFGLALYIPYIPGAALAGRLTRSHTLGAAATLRIVTVLMGLCALWLVFFHDRYSLWLAIPVYNMLAGAQWPIVESYVSAGSQGPEMRKAIGRFNLTWAMTLCPSLWIVGWLIDQPAIVFSLLTASHLTCAFLTLRWPANPPEHDAESQKLHTGPEYGQLLISARILLPVSYVVMYAFTPLLPSIWQKLGQANSIGAILSSTWMFARLAAFATMYVSRGWHGRWGALLLGSLLYIGGFALLLLAPTVWVALLGLVVFGAGQGMVYYCALYYGMAVGHAKVDSGGTHETVIGIGYASGPALGLVGTVLLGGGGAVVTLICCVAAAGGVAACQPYLKARRLR
ncbi:MAG: hypothetical protein D8M59_14590 [Planctomycetes bacterium]|nr:hypothetical protein [Planctomycetota bacterium]NOG53335.1 hypothetical protein [Planctomycetota bacterium]